MAAHSEGYLVETKLILDRFTFFPCQLSAAQSYPDRRHLTPLFITTHLANTERTRQGL